MTHSDATTQQSTTQYAAAECVSERSARLSDLVLVRRHELFWWIGFGISSLLVLLLLVSIAVLFYQGVGVWGINIPVAWGFAIVNFVWWIGIGHAGTFISAVLLLCNQSWRASINRCAEAMTLFAIACAGMFPVLHLGRPQRLYWLIPYPNTLELWPQFRSALIWDEFAIFTYGTVSLIFWYIGLIPDFATLRVRAPTRLKRLVYGVLALGWRGESRDWHNYHKAYAILAGLATPLVVSVHSIVSLDFAETQLPGWHDTIFPPYFVAGALFSGFAMVLTVLIPLRAVYRLQDLITDAHLDRIAKIILATSLIVSYGYIMEWFMAGYSGDRFHRHVVFDRLTGNYRIVMWVMLFCNIIVPQALWLPRIRRSVVTLFVLSILVNVGMWLERFIIVVTSLHQDFLPSSWGMFYPTFWDIATLLGSFGLFFWLFFLFIRYFPPLSIHELRSECYGG